MSWSRNQHSLVLPVCASSSTSVENRSTDFALIRISGSSSGLHLKLHLLGSASRVRYGGPAQRPRRGVGVRHSPSDDQVSAPTEMITHLQLSLSNQVRIASSPSFTSSGFTSSPSSSPIPLPIAEDCCPSSFERGWLEPSRSSSGIMTPLDIKAIKDLKIMKSCHDFTSTLSIESLVMIRKHFNISGEYALHAPLPRQHPYHKYPGGFDI
ncbi:hypothetical protein GW17_00049134 [Ensete ventricosum]|nr:hypothetical protein GW17_00049134 [Ensete ventricosum]